jgi:competence protein CoiA
MAESKQHADLKAIAAAAAEEAGWTVEFEVSRTSPSGKRWQADVLLEKDGREVAVEVQWSPQKHVQYLKRQTKYLETGVEVIWLHRTKKLQPTREVVEARLQAKSSGKYEVVLAGFPNQRVPVERFVKAALESKVRFGISKSDPINVVVLAANMECWHDDCNCSYPIIPQIWLTYGSMDLAPDNPNDPTTEFDSFAAISLDQIGHYPELEKALVERLVAEHGWGHIKHRYSRTREEEYLSCGCPECGRIAGDFYVFPHIYDATPAIRFRTKFPNKLWDEYFEDFKEGIVSTWLIWD